MPLQQHIDTEPLRHVTRLHQAVIVVSRWCVKQTVHLAWVRGEDYTVRQLLQPCAVRCKDVYGICIYYNRYTGTTDLRHQCNGRVFRYPQSWTNAQCAVFVGIGGLCE